MKIELELTNFSVKYVNSEIGDYQTEKEFIKSLKTHPPSSITWMYFKCESNKGDSFHLYYKQGKASKLTWIVSKDNNNTFSLFTYSGIGVFIDELRENLKRNLYNQDDEPPRIPTRDYPVQVGGIY